MLQVSILSNIGYIITPHNNICIFREYRRARRKGIECCSNPQLTLQIPGSSSAFHYITFLTRKLLRLVENPIQSTPSRCFILHHIIFLSFHNRSCIFRERIYRKKRDLTISSQISHKYIQVVLVSV